MKEKDIIKHLPETAYSGMSDSVNKDSEYTNAWGLIIIPLVVFISIIYIFIKVLL